MDRAEEIARDCLNHLGFATVVHEPDGNVPPDFLVDGRIAVEVRRLNQNYVRGKRYRGLEEDDIPLLMRMRRLLASLGPAQDQSWFVFYEFTRPLPKWKQLEPAIRAALQGFKNLAERKGTEWTLTESFRLSVVKSNSQFDDYFVLGGNSDGDSGGWLLNLLEQNIKLCVAEKTEKIEAVRDRYPEWWLLLVDHIGYGLNSFERQLFRSEVHIDHDWDRVVLVNPLNHRHYFEL